MNNLIIAIIVIYSFNFLTMLAMIFLERKTPASIITWTLTIFSLPGLGIFIYWLFGHGPRFSKLRWSKHKKQTDLILKEKLSTGSITLFTGEEERVQKELITLNGIVSEAPCTTYNDVQIYVDAATMYEAQLLDFRNAKTSINILYYIFNTDEVGKKFRDELTKKAREGVKVNLMYDDSANFKTGRVFFSELIKAGGNVNPFFPSMIKGLNMNMNFRNHRKIVVIDGQIGYVGGMNIGNEYMSKNKKISPWRDTHIRVVGEAVALLQKRFLQDFASGGTIWRRKHFSVANALDDFYFPEPIKTSTLSPIQIISSGPDKDSQEIKFCYEKMISLAKKEIFLESPYFIPDEAFLENIILAQKSGIQVHLIVPGVYDKFTVYQVTVSWLEPVLKAGVKVYLYRGFCHSKIVLVDDFAASIGTANLDVRSFSLNFEVSAILYGDKEIATCRQIFERDIENSEILTFEQYKNRSWLRKGAESLFRIFSNIM